MSNLKLVADEPTQLERLLLEASRQEQPSDEHKARLRAALGLGAPLADPVPAPPAASASVSSGAAKSASLGKIALGVGVLGALAALWLARPTTEVSSAPAPVAPAPEVQVRVAPTPVPAEPVPVAAEPAPALEISPPPLPQSTVAAPAPARVRAAPSAASADDLSEQIRLIEAARAGVAARDAKSALSALNDYSSKFPRGSFGQEASVLRIRAIDQSGDSARATAMAKAFIARFPSSPHVARLKPIAERGASR